jgi:cysteinyl-tRNA synthetase
VAGIRIQDTLSGQIRELEPRAGGEVGIYACGPTVYGRIHIGNARPFVVFTLLKRFLAHQGLDAKLVINVTDINDKIYDAAREAGRASAEYAEEMTAAYVADTDALGLGRPDAEPLATETIAEIVSLIESLIEEGHAYQANGDVYFRVHSFDGYGKLSNRDTDQMDQGEEAGTASLKEDRLDFALWKGQKEGEDTSWDSPWGKGRPGWHIECSAMSEKELGVDFAVHGGGIDLVFPHHENEIAQTRCAFHSPLMANFWMHNGFLQVEGAKMAKSEGNFITIRELLADWPGEVLRLNMLRTHYRQPIDWTVRGLEESSRTLDEWYALSATTNAKGIFGGEHCGLQSPFLDALCDDLNTPKAITELHQLRNAAVHDHGLPALTAFIGALKFLGFLNETWSNWDARKHSIRGIDASKIEKLKDERNAARKAKNFKEADRIRDELNAMGIELEDHKDGTTTWKVKR